MGVLRHNDVAVVSWFRCQIAGPDYDKLKVPSPDRGFYRISSTGAVTIVNRNRRGGNEVSIAALCAWPNATRVTAPMRVADSKSLLIGVRMADRQRRRENKMLELMRNTLQLGEGAQAWFMDLPLMMQLLAGAGAIAVLWVVWIVLRMFLAALRTAFRGL